MIDLRSDTITCPTKEMRRAMLDGAVGDDVFGEDTTDARAEEYVAVLLVGRQLFTVLQVLWQTESGYTLSQIAATR